MQLTAMIANFIYSVIGEILTHLFMYLGFNWAILGAKPVD